MKSLKVFLSSTFKDLKESRQSVLKFLSVLDTDLISMEVFGSDVSKPKDFCLQEVRKSNFFIGIYAARYGSINEDSGMSMTEEEYHEAFKMYEEGKLNGLHIYVIDSKASWPLDFVDIDSTQANALKKFKKLIKSRHTITYFTKSDDLPFLILRDFIKKLELGFGEIIKKRNQASIGYESSLSRPVGMEFYTQSQNQLFFGRENEINALVSQVINHRISLLVGVSGIGKTSLVNAGLKDAIEGMGWIVAIIRPLNNAIHNLSNQLWNQLLHGIKPNEFSFIDSVNAVLTASPDKHVLIVIDQFEDLLENNDSNEVSTLTAELYSLANASASNLHLLIGYRGDIESDVGKIWQKVSGSSGGLPRFYLGILSKENAVFILEQTFGALGIKLIKKEHSKFISEIIEDLFSESIMAGYKGIYPPFIQMIVSSLYSHYLTHRQIKISEYHEKGRSKRIIAQYLIDQLVYLADKKKVGEYVLISLVSSYGTKSQKSIEEIVVESGESKRVVEKVLLELVNLRLVRKLDDLYEVAHDYLSKLILDKLATDEEKEVKKFRNLLSSKAAAYATTSANLIVAEHVMLYRYREKISINSEELTLLINGYREGTGPIGYWLANAPSEILSTIKEPISKRFFDTNFESNYFYLKEPYEASLNLDKDSLDDKNITETLKVFARRTSEKGRVEFDFLIKQYSGTRHKSVFHEMSSKKQIYLQYAGVTALGFIGDLKDIDILRQLSGTFSVGETIIRACYKAIARIYNRYNKWEELTYLLLNENRNWSNFAFEGLMFTNEAITVEKLITLLNSCDGSDPIFSKIIELICINAKESDKPKLKKLLSDLEHVNFTYSLIHQWIAKHGKEEDFDFFLDLIMNARYDFDFHKKFIVALNIGKIATKKHLPQLRKLIQKDHFWEEFAVEGEHFPIKNELNVFFLRWVIGIAFGYVAQKKDLPVLLKMLNHNYWTINRAGVMAIGRLGNLNEIDLLIEMLSDSNESNIVDSICSIDQRIHKAAWRYFEDASGDFFDPRLNYSRKSNAPF